MSSFNWYDMDFFKSKHWVTAQERLQGKMYNPGRDRLFAALDATPFEQVKVGIFGQDPYPNSTHATGIAFSVSKSVSKLPPTLVNLLKEYQDDLHYPTPASGCLDCWCARGVLLWNVCPTCEPGKPGSHSHWEEWHQLTKEVVQRLNKDCKVLVFLGAKARAFKDYVNSDWSEVIETSHPSPLGARSGFNPFLGSRLFTSINAKLKDEAINWRLP